MQTILGAFDDRETAQRAVDQLLARGFTDASIHLQTGATSDRPAADTATNRGMMASVGNFFSRLFGESDEKKDAGNYAEAVRCCSSVVAVDTSDDSEVQMAESIMGQLGTVDVDNRAE
jgi:cytosine/adenosine deaminase-related metal-dependent hydrolase